MLICCLHFFFGEASAEVFSPFFIGVVYVIVCWSVDWCSGRD